MLRRQEKDRKWRSNLKRVEKEVVQLEEDEWQLERVYPQVCVCPHAGPGWPCSLLAGLFTSRLRRSLRASPG